MSATTSFIPHLAAKIFIVTGGNTGIGFGITTHLLRHKAKRIYVLSSSNEHWEKARAQLESEGLNTDALTWNECDLADLHAVDKVAKRLAEEAPRIDALICNAGIGIVPFKLSADGIDSHFQINFLSHLHLIRVLLPNLRATAAAVGDARIVLQSSEQHRLVTPSTQFASIDELNNSDTSPLILYNRSKLAQLLGMAAFVRRLRADKLDAGLYVNCSHPGADDTSQLDQAAQTYGLFGKLSAMVVKPFLRDAREDGCLSALWAATALEVREKGISGRYIAPQGALATPSAKAVDEKLQENLWNLSEELLKEKLGA